jgi:DNA repair exonuclease SbcCD nuclease subunit
MSSEKLLITAVGDTTCSKNAREAFKNIANLNPSLNLFLGDSSYIKEGDPSYDKEAAKCFTDIISENNLKEITMFTLGNHDDEENDGTKVGEELIKYFGVPSNVLYTRIVGNVYVISMNSQDFNWDRGNSEQCKWVIEKLEEATKLRDVEKKIDWIFILIHKPLYTLEANHSPERKARDVYHPLFDKYQVDFVLHGHNHDQQRTKPISYGGLDNDPVITSDTVDKYDFSTKHGQIFIVSGAGGRKLADFKEGKNKWTVLAQNTNFGYHTFNVEGKNMVVKAQYNDGEVKDTFSVSK